MSIALRSIHLTTAPGLPDGLMIRDLSPGLNVVIGPNASGKSTVSRTMRRALWGEHTPAGVVGVLTWDLGEESFTRVDVAHGSVRWADRKPPTTDHSHSDRYELDLTDLLQKEDADRKVADQILRDLYGGYDLGAAMKAVGKPKATHRKLTGGLQRAVTNLQKAEDEADKLRKDERRLQEVGRQLAETADAADRVEQLEHILKWRRLSADQRANEDALAALPAGLDKLRPNDLDDVVNLQGAVRKAQGKLDGAREKLTDAQDALSKLDASVVTKGQVDEIEEHGQHWARALTEQTSALAEAEKKQGALQAARDALFAEPRAGSTLSEAQIDKLEQLVADGRALHAAHDVAKKLQRAWYLQAAELEVTSASGEEDIQSRLYQWLQMPKALAVQSGPPGWILYVAIGGFLVGAALVLIAGLAGVVGIVGGLVAGLSLGVAIGAFVISKQATTDDPFHVHRDNIEREVSGSRWAPKSWDVQSVTQQLQHIQRALQARAVEQELARFYRDNRSNADAALEDAKLELRNHEPKAAALLAKTGLKADLLTLTVAYQAGRLRDWASAAEAAKASADELKVREDVVSTHFKAMEVAWPSEGVALPSNPPSLDAQCRAWREEISNREAAERDVESAEAAVSREADALAEAQEREAQLWETLALPADLDVLKERLGYLDTYEDLIRTKERLAEQLEELAWVQPLLASWQDRDDEALQHERDILGQDEASRAELLVEQGGLKEKLDAAREGNTLIGLRSEVYQQREELNEQREADALQALTGRVLAAIGKAQERDHVPAMLERARARLLAFTKGRWRLDVRDDGTFTAFDVVERARRDLSELSDGTRVQLRLAVRLAAVEEAEGDRDALPLCLDEVLNTTDPQRFREVAETLLSIAEEGRQVVYFSAIPEDSGRWAQAADALGKPRPTVHHMGPPPADWSDAPAVPEPPPALPTPEGKTLAQWAEELSVGRPSPRKSAGSWSVIYLLPDNLQTAHGLMLSHVMRVGQWRGMRDRITHVADDIKCTLDARVAALEALVDGWKQGRGRQPTAQEVRASGGVSAKFEESVLDLLSKLGPGEDAETFLERVGQLPRFSTKQREKVRAHFVAIGVIDEEPVLDRDTWISSAIQAGAAAGGELEDVRRWVYQSLPYWDV